MQHSHNIFAFTLGLFFFYGCSNHKETSTELKTIAESKEKMKLDRNFGQSFTPSEIGLSLSISDSLKGVIKDNKDLFVKVNPHDESLYKSVVTVLLKQYVYELEKAKISFDMLNYRDTTTMVLMDYFFSVNEIDTVGFRIGSTVGQGYSYSEFFNVVKKDNRLKSDEIRGLITKLEKQQKDNAKLR